MGLADDEPAGLPAAKAQPRNYLSIQYLRAIAALMVVFHHARNPIPGLSDPLANFGAGAAGVSIFFVISGFIMYTAARDEKVRTFAWRRLTRIVPMYWIATFVVLMAHEGLRLHQMTPELAKHVVESLLFIPHHDPYSPGDIAPYLVPGWTLNFEMFFYALFAVGLAVRRLVLFLASAIGALVLAGIALHFHNALWLTYTNLILLEFLAGIFIGVFAGRLTSGTWAWLLPLGFVGLGLSGLSTAPHLLTWGLPATMMVVGAIALEQSGRLADLALLAVLGNASYSIYLFQPLIFDFPERILHMIPFQGLPQLIAMVALSATAAVLIGIAAHYTLERRIMRALSVRRASKPASTVAEAVTG